VLKLVEGNVCFELRVGFLRRVLNLGNAADCSIFSLFYVFFMLLLLVFFLGVNNTLCEDRNERFRLKIVNVMP